MPRPHYAVQAGTRVVPRSEKAGVADAGGACPSCKQKAGEIERLRGELAQARSGGGGIGGARRSSVIMWGALALCGASLIFALAAILRHG